VRLAHDVVAADRGTAGGRREKRRQDPEQRRLAAAVRSEQAEDLAAPDGEREAVECEGVTVGVSQRLDREDLALPPGAPGIGRDQSDTLSKVINARSAGR
jgi:hypothetical protein